MYQLFQIWRFHRGGKSLLSDHLIDEGLNNERISLLLTEEVPGNAQRLFAVIGNGIKVTPLHKHVHVPHMYMYNIPVCTCTYVYTRLHVQYHYTTMILYCNKL